MVCSRYPKECRYYETVLKRKCLIKLKNNVWENKTKWTLVDKAIAHRRCKLLCKYFGAWMAYVVERFKKKINARSADSFHEERLKARGILALKKNINQNWLLLRICRKTFEWNLKRRTWHQWKHYTQKRLKVREIKLLANRIREERLRIRYIYLWSFRLNEKRSQEEATKKIHAKCDAKLKRTCLESWKVFTSRKKFKKKIESLAIVYHENKMLDKFFFLWKNHFFKKRRYRSHLEVVKRFYEKDLMKNYLAQWWAICKKVKLGRKLSNYQSARDFYTRTLLRRSFGKLWEAGKTRRRLHDKTKEFRSRYENTLMSYYMDALVTRRREKVWWNIHEAKALKWREDWLTIWALTQLTERYKERMEEHEDMSKVVKYSNSITMHRAFRAWTEFTVRKLDKKIKTQNACEFFDERTIQKSFTKWKEFVCRKFRKKMADEYYVTTLLLKCTNQWRVFLQQRKTILKEAENLEKLQKIKLMQKTFGCWKNELEVLKRKNMAAIHFYTISNLSRAFRKWTKFTQRKILSKNQYNANKTILQGVIIQSVLFRWNEEYLRRQCISKKLEKFKTKRHKRLVGLCFVNWSKFVEKMKRIREAALCYPQIKTCLLLEEYFALLMKGLELKKVAKRKEDLARRTEERLLKRKYLKKLVLFVCWKKERILRCISEERKKEKMQGLDVSVTTGKAPRRNPIIPEYLKAHIETDEFEGYRVQGLNRNVHPAEEDWDNEPWDVNEDTFRVINPSNLKLPVIDHYGDEASAFFNT